MTDQELDKMLDVWVVPEPPLSLRADLERKLPARPRRKLLGLPWRWAAAAALSAAGLAVGTSIAVLDPTIGTTGARLSDGTHIRTATMVEPKVLALSWFHSWGGGMRTKGQRQMHYFYDRMERTYSGYEATYVPQGNGSYSVTLAQLTATLPELSGGRLPDYQRVPLPAIPTPRVVGLREPFEIDLMRSQNGGKRIYDRIELSSVEFEQRPPDDGPFANMMMEVVNPRLYVGGRYVPAPGLGSARGATLFVTLPGRGRWTIAVDPNGNSRFVEAGEVEGATLEFTLNGERFRIESDKHFVQGGRRKIYVMHQPDAQLDPGLKSNQEAQFGASGPPSLFR